MINFSEIDTDTIMARGQYATVRGAHEDEKKRLSVLCGQLSSASSQILRYMQPPDDETPDAAAVQGMLHAARSVINDIEKCVSSIEDLALQRGALKKPAWGKN